jgi:hypothetical protein
MNIILSNLNLNTSNSKKPYKLLNIMNNNKKSINYKNNKEKPNYHKINKNRDNQNNNNKRGVIEKNNNKNICLKNSFYDREKSAYLISQNNNSLDKNMKKNSHNFIKSEENNKNRIIKAKINNTSNNRDNSTRRKEYQDNESTSINSKRAHIFRENSLSKKYSNYNLKGPISYIYANINNSMINNNLINSYNKEYTNNIFNKNNNNHEIKYKKNYINIFQNDCNTGKYNSQILTEINDDHKYKNNNRNKNDNNNKRLIRDHMWSPVTKNKEYNDNNYQNKIIHKKISQQKFSLKDINIKSNYDSKMYDNRYNNGQYVKRGRSTRQKTSFSEITSIY